MDARRAKIFLMADPLIQEDKKHPKIRCEKIDVYKYLMTLCDREAGTEPDDIEWKENHGHYYGHCTQCGHVVVSDERYCCNCGEHQLWEEVQT